MKLKYDKGIWKIGDYITNTNRPKSKGYIDVIVIWKVIKSVALESPGEFELVLVWEQEPGQYEANPKGNVYHQTKIKLAITPQLIAAVI